MAGMKKWKKIVLAGLIIGIVAAGAVIAYVYLKPHPDVTKMKGVTISAQQLYDAFKTNEAEANAKYNNQAIVLTGEVATVTKNQDGFTVIDFKTNDPMVVINCTFKTDPGTLTPGQTVTFKGICTGYIPDAVVVINEGVLEK